MRIEPPIGRIGIQMSALALALKAKVGALDLVQLNIAQAQAQTMLDDADPLACAIVGFATVARADRNDPDALKTHGERLQRSLEEDMGPHRPERRDTDG